MLTTAPNHLVVKFKGVSSCLCPSSTRAVATRSRGELDSPLLRGDELLLLVGEELRRLGEEEVA